MDAVLEPGDIQLLNNHTVLHARTAFVDYEVLRLGCELLLLQVASAECKHPLGVPCASSTVSQDCGRSLMNTSVTSAATERMSSIAVVSAGRVLTP